MVVSHLMKQKQDLAIILRSIAYQERHRIVTALTLQEGQISVIAHNAIQSRRFGGTLDLFTAGEWLYVSKPGAELGRLEEAKTLRAFEGLRKDFEGLSLASVFNELMLRLAPREQACSDLFRLHSNALACLDEKKELLEKNSISDVRFHLSLLNGYLTKLLQWSGSQPRILHCLSCSIHIETLDPEESLSCVIQDAGWICPSCRAQTNRHIYRRHEDQAGDFNRVLLKISPRSVFDFHLGLALPIRQIPGFTLGEEAEQKELFRFLEALFIYHIPGFDQKPLKSLRFLGLESNLPPQAANFL